METGLAHLPGKEVQLAFDCFAQEWEGISSNVSRSMKGFKSIRKAVL